MSEKLSIVMCEVGKEAKERVIENKLKSFQNLVGGNIEFFDLDDEILIWLKDNKFENKVKLSFI